MVTMKEIAKKAGVSQATVSRVMSGNPSVNPEIRMAVMEWVRKLDYQPNVIAQSLASNRSLLIGVIITDISNPFFSDVIKAVESEALKYGYSIILCNTDWNLDKEKKYINILRSYNADGILIVPTNPEDKYFKTLKNMETPVVVITQDVKGFSCISISHYNSGKEVAKHLIKMGYSKFVFMGDEKDEKYRGFKDEIQNAGFNVEHDVFAVKNSKADSKHKELKEFISKNSQNENGIGIFAYNDIEALLVLHTLKECKVKVPEKVALVGFDNTFISKEVSPSISSVAQPVEEIGRKSVEMLIDKINDKKNKEENHILLEPRIVVRESSIKTTGYSI
ncbi:MAG: LacI family DNA-binding transcriptional regulator [Clostridiaceae bacterium]